MVRKFIADFLFKVVRDSLVLDCKCHGITAQCTKRYCRRILTIDFPKVSKKIFAAYKNAMQVKLKKTSSTRMELIQKRKKFRRPGELAKSMTYLYRSRDFCSYDRRNKLPGTSGRTCGHKYEYPSSQTSSKRAIVDRLLVSKCKMLCCGRGHQTVLENVKIKCRCKFDFRIMDVRCKTCIARKNTYVCN